MVGDYISYGMITVLCLLCIISDLRNGIIPNRYLSTYGGIAVLVHVINLMIHFPEKPIVYLVTIIIGICVSVILYFSNTWAGGDCKLFIVLICAMPSSIVQTEIRGISLILWLVIVAFLIGYIYLIVCSFKESVSEYRKSVSNKTEKPKAWVSIKQGGIKTGKRFLEYLQVFFFLAFVNYFIQKLFLFLTRVAGDVISNALWSIALFAIDILVLYIVQKIRLLSSKWVILTIIGADLVLGIIDFDSFLNRWNFLIWLSVCATWIIKDLVEKYNYEEIEIIKIQKGMILSTASSMLLYSLDKSNTLRISDESLKCRLSEMEVDKIHAIGEKNQKISSVEIVRKVPFAAFLSLAALLVILYERGI